MADNAMNLIIVTPEREVVREEVEELEIPGSEGYFGVLPGHAPLFSEVKVGEVAYRKGTGWTFLAVAWGFVEVQPDQVRILAETAERAHEIDVDRATRAKQRAEEMISRGGEDVDYNQALVALERAIVRIQVSQKAHQQF
jgi:F-type H+-transporting ATPase subunit epsilon